MEETRLDKWLWAARFFKTRTMATDAINGGKVHYNGQRVKPSRKVHVGDEVRVSIGQIEKIVIVKDLAERRGSATIAQSLYEETPESIVKREAHQEMMKSAPRVERSTGRPTKRDRRHIIKFRQSFDE